MRKNAIAAVLFGIGLGIIIVCLFAGIFAGQVRSRFSTETSFHIVLALPWWIGGFISGMFFVGLSEGLKLLQEIRNKLYENEKKEEKREQPEQEKKSEPDPPAENDAVFHGVSMHIGPMKHDGCLKITPETLSFYEEDDTKIFEMDRNNIESLTIVDDPPTHTHVAIGCKDDQANDVTITFFCRSDPEKVGREIYGALKRPAQEQSS